MLALYGKSSSINVRKVLWLCTELDLAIDRQHHDSRVASADIPGLRALNPNALVPVLRDGDFVLWESNSICRYLAARQRRTDLLPDAPQARALVEQWMDWQATDLNAAWRYAFLALVRDSPAHRDATAIARSTQDWHRHMGILDAQLQRTGAYAAGAHFTLADIVLGLSTQRWMATPMARPPLPAVTAYYERLSARPGFLAHGRNGLP
ncbi:glutathione S-transferase family protein [Xanthomonas medicagonis]|uniref:glutathione S-transferase family protein n=1 Tax=Xanthomonas medicagonis TaxID=3160841 RepID=UPI0035161A06